jgi:hypothetical protein
VRTTLSSVVRVRSRRRRRNRFKTNRTTHPPRTAAKTIMPKEMRMSIHWALVNSNGFIKFSFREKK